MTANRPPLTSKRDPLSIESMNQIHSRVSTTQGVVLCYSDGLTPTEIIAEVERMLLAPMTETVAPPPEETYEQQAHRTESPVNHSVQDRLVNIKTGRLVHGILGVSSECGELADQLKRHIFYGRPLDEVNISEECGDILWYIALIANVLGVSIDQMMATNISKLKARYPEKFTEQRATDRDLSAEREILERDLRPLSECLGFCKGCGTPVMQGDPYSVKMDGFIRCAVCSGLPL